MLTARDPSQRLALALLPESGTEVEAIEAVGTGHAAGVLANLVERAIKKAFLRGAETGRREIEEERDFTRKLR